VDNDLTVVAHARALLTRLAGVDVAEADLSAPASILEHPGIGASIDWSEPVCVLLAMVLQLIMNTSRRTLDIAEKVHLHLFGKCLDKRGRGI
jgi:hypothetical protein